MSGQACLTTHWQARLLQFALLAQVMGNQTAIMVAGSAGQLKEALSSYIHYQPD